IDPAVVPSALRAQKPSWSAEKTWVEPRKDSRGLPSASTDARIIGLPATSAPLTCSRISSVSSMAMPGSPWASAAGERGRALLDEVGDALLEVLGGEALLHVGVGRVSGLGQGLEEPVPDLALHFRERPRRNLAGQHVRIVHHLG